MRPLLVGEDNPYSADPRHALFPHPERSAGYRIATVILGLTRAEYLRRFDRVNLCAGKWSAPEARETARRIELRRPPRAPIILLGRKVADAFGVARPPFSIYAFDGGRPRFYLLPHPSGLSRVWNEPGAIERARALLAPLLSEPTPPLCGHGCLRGCEHCGARPGS